MGGWGGEGGDGWTVWCLPSGCCSWQHPPAIIHMHYVDWIVCLPWSACPACLLFDGPTACCPPACRSAELANVKLRRSEKKVRRPQASYQMRPQPTPSPLPTAACPPPGAWSLPSVC